MKPAANENKEEDLRTSNRVAKTSSGENKLPSSRRKKNDVKPGEVKQEKVAPNMFRLDVPIPIGMQLDHFRPGGTPCHVLDPITPGPTIP